MIGLLMVLGFCIAVMAAAVHGWRTNAEELREDAMRHDLGRMRARGELEAWFAGGMVGVPPPPPPPPNVLRSSGLPLDFGACERGCERENARRKADWLADMEHWSARLDEARGRKVVRVLNHNGPAPVHREPLPPPAPPPALPGGGH